MNRMKKVILMLAVTCFSLLVSTPCAEAQWYAEAAAEAALLTQQIAQFLQDLGFDIEKWSDVEKRLKEVRNIAKTVSQNSQSFKNIANATDHVIKTGKAIVSYQEYILTFGDNFRIERSYYIYNRFMRQTTYLIDEVQHTIQSFDRLRDAKPLQYVRSVNDATESVATIIQEMGDEAKTETAELCFKVAQDEVAAQNQKFFSLRMI